jgi:hypothetical protein
MSNPYESPQGDQQRQNHDSASAAADVKAPAIALLVVSLIAIAVGILGLVGDAILLTSGAVERLEAMNNRSVSPQTTIMIRTAWGIILLVASAYVCYGALKMMKLKNYGTARFAAIIAMIPLVSPCCLLGIPFGIWAFVVLGKPHVRDAFQ